VISLNSSLAHAYLLVNPSRISSIPTFVEFSPTHLWRSYHYSFYYGRGISLTHFLRVLLRSTLTENSTSCPTLIYSFLETFPVGSERLFSSHFIGFRFWIYFLRYHYYESPEKRCFAFFREILSLSTPQQVLGPKVLRTLFMVFHSGVLLWEYTICSSPPSSKMNAR